MFRILQTGKQLWFVKLNRIEKRFAELKAKNKKAFVTYVMASDPDFVTSQEIVKKIADSGADIIELGMPFSDPSAEGPTIQKAAMRALDAKGSIKNTFEIVKDFRKQNSTTPIILMGYLNPILNHGVEKFVNESKEIGVDGFIIVDLPPEEDLEFTKYSKKEGLSFIRLLTPTTTDERAKKVLESSSGFVYYVSITGVTGVKSAVKTEVGEHIAKIKKLTSLPVCVGFGIKNAEQAKEFSEISDGIIIGSAIIDILEKNLSNKKDAVKKIEDFVKEVSSKIKSI